MKYVKMLGLAAVAAMALMAFAGAGTASATVLCKTQLTTGCAAAGWDYSGTIEASIDPGSNARLETTGGLLRVTCTESTVTGSSSTGGGSSTETVSGTVATANLTWGGCGAEHPTATLEGGTLEVHHITGTDNGTLTGIGFKVTTTILGETCIFTAGAGSDLGTVTGGAMATMDLNGIVELVSSGSGSNCPATGRWTGNYTVTNPEPLYVATS